MNCPLCGKDAIAIFSSVECGTLRCPNYNKEQFEIVSFQPMTLPEGCLFYVDFQSITKEDIEKGIFRARIQIPTPAKFIMLNFSIDNKELQ